MILQHCRELEIEVERLGEEVRELGDRSLAVDASRTILMKVLELPEPVLEEVVKRVIDRQAQAPSEVEEFPYRPEEVAL